MLLGGLLGHSLYYYMVHVYENGDSGIRGRLHFDSVRQIHTNIYGATGYRHDVFHGMLQDELDAFKGIDKVGGSFLKAMEDRTRSYGEAKNA